MFRNRPKSAEQSNPPSSLPVQSLLPLSEYKSAWNMENMDPTIMRDETMGEQHNYDRFVQILRPQSAPGDGKVAPIQAGPPRVVYPGVVSRHRPFVSTSSDPSVAAAISARSTTPSMLPSQYNQAAQAQHNGTARAQGQNEPAFAEVALDEYSSPEQQQHQRAERGRKSPLTPEQRQQAHQLWQQHRMSTKSPASNMQAQQYETMIRQQQGMQHQQLQNRPVEFLHGEDHGYWQQSPTSERSSFNFLVDQEQYPPPAPEHRIFPSPGPHDHHHHQRCHFPTLPSHHSHYHRSYLSQSNTSPIVLPSTEALAHSNDPSAGIPHPHSTSQQMAAFQANAQRLQASLPPHIYAQLTQDQLQQQGAYAQTEKGRSFALAQQQRHKTQYHTAIQHTALQRSKYSHDALQNKQQSLESRPRSTTMSQKSQSTAMRILPAAAEASEFQFLHSKKSQENSTPAPDQTDLSTPASTNENGCTDFKNPEEMIEEHGSEDILDTGSIGALNAVSVGCRRDAQLHPAQAEPSWLDSRTNFHISKRGRVGLSHSPASFAEFSCETCHQAQVQLQELRFKVSALEAKNRQLEQEKLDVIEWAKAKVKPYIQPKWVTIYEVSDDRSTRWFEDQPQWLQKQDRQVYLGGKKPIFNLEAFLRQLQLGKVPFIVFQEYTKLRHPDVLTQDIQNWPPPRSSNVSMQIISFHLSKTFGALLDEHNELKEHADFQKPLHDDDDDNDDVSEVNGWKILNEDDSDAERVSRRLLNIDLLYFHFQDLFEEGLNSRTEGDHSETDLLLKFLRTGFKRNHMHARELLSQKKISKDTIAYLFKPGAVIVSHNALRVRGLKQTELLRTFPVAWDLSCQSWTFDGKFHQKSEDLLLPGKDLQNGSMNITSLPFYPLQYAEPEIDQKLLHRGKTFWKFRKPVYVAYSGLDMRGDTAYDQARFLIDPITWKRYQQAGLSLREDIPMANTVEQSNELDESLMLQSDLPSTEFPYLVPENITGFNMQDKKWVDLQVDNISEVKWDKRSFDNLAIAEENKKIIKALVLNKIERDKATDVVPGKGNGLVILLHGGPGTGKTLTAESVADLAEKPLYRVTCGDIGTEPRKVEEYLENVFFLGKIWDCVVLLDEADVFLEQRSLSDLARNALVSVFLRTLEYYDGILILTSNRVGTFDEAFKSRIQLALHYDSLSEEQRRHIWYTFIKRLEELKEPIEAKEMYTNIETLSKEQLNGRQIRNAITTARQLALFEGVNLNFRHLQESIKVSGQFDEYLQELHGPDDKRMQNEGIRLAPKSDLK